MEIIDIDEYKEACIELQQEIENYNDNIKYSQKKWRYFKKEIHKLSYPYKSMKKSEIKAGDKVLYVGSFIGTVDENRIVKLKGGSKINSLDSQPHKFRKIILL